MRSAILLGSSLLSITALAFNFSAIVPTPHAESPVKKEAGTHGHNTRQVASAPAHPGSHGSFEYTVLKDETAWFLSHVFYGKGQEFHKILDSNGLSKPEQIKEGMTLKIEGALFAKTHVGFAERYTDLWEKRSAALEKKSADINGGEYRDRAPANTQVERDSVVPVQHIRSKDSVSSLPFSQPVDHKVSPSDQAKDELFHRKMRKANPEGGH